MKPNTQYVKVLCNDDEKSSESLVETQDLKTKLEDSLNNQIKAIETNENSQKEPLNEGPSLQSKNAAKATGITKRNPKSLIRMLLVSLMVSQLMYLLLITIVVPYGRIKYGKELNAIHYGVIGSMQ